MDVLPTTWENGMPVNQLYHDRGVALARALGPDLPGPKDRQAIQDRPRDQDTLTASRNKRDAVIASRDRFEIFREEEVQVSSTQFSGGDWRWRLADPTGKTLVEGIGYRSERACKVAVALLRDRAFSAG
jgi:uncharacterized protein YegP (UPF0339 family)